MPDGEKTKKSATLQEIKNKIYTSFTELLFHFKRQYEDRFIKKNYFIFLSFSKLLNTKNIAFSSKADIDFLFLNQTKPK